MLFRWPVIVAIIVGGIIAFSVVWCIARCICCGAECAICCCKCCTCCCGSSGSSHKRMKSDAKGYPPPQPYPQQPYPQQSYPPQQPYASPNIYAEARSFAPPPPPPAPVNTQYSQPTPRLERQPTNPNFNPQINPKFAPKSPEQPQFATFDAHSKPVNEDALPQMPSWSDARDVHVQVEEEAVPEKRGDVEMDRLNYNGSAQQLGMNSMAAGAAGAGMRGSPGGTRGSPGGQGRSPVSPNDGYGFPAQSQNTSPPYGASPYGQTGYDRGPSPAQNQNISPASYGQNSYDRRPSPAVSYSQYSQGSDQYERRAQQAPYVAPLQPYNMDELNSAHQSYMSPAPAPDRYNSPAPPSYHTNAPRNPDPYAYAPTPVQPYNQPNSSTPGYGNGGYGYGSGNAGYDPVPNRSQTATPTAYPGQPTYQAFTPVGQQSGGQQSGVTRKPVNGSLREV
jgi:hypothetical protein